MPESEAANPEKRSLRSSNKGANSDAEFSGASDSSSSENNAKVDLAKNLREDYIASMPSLSLLLDRLRQAATEDGGPEAQQLWLSFIKECCEDDGSHFSPFHSKLDQMDYRQVAKDLELDARLNSQRVKWFESIKDIL